VDLGTDGSRLVEVLHQRAWERRARVHRVQDRVTECRETVGLGSVCPGPCDGRDGDSVDEGKRIAKGEGIQPGPSSIPPSSRWVGSRGPGRLRSCLISCGWGGENSQARARAASFQLGKLGRRGRRFHDLVPASCGDAAVRVWSARGRREPELSPSAPRGALIFNCFEAPGPGSKCLSA